MEELINLYNQKIGAEKQDKEAYELALAKEEELRARLVHIEQAREVIKAVSLMTQRQLEEHISSIVSLALSAVFDDPYSLKLNFVERRGKTECDLVFTRDGQEVDPMSASGGGAIDVASMALRIACWSLKPKKTRNTIILDEPFRYLSKGLQHKAGDMLKMISEKLGLQIIMVTHNPELIEASDRVFTVENKKGVSYVS